MLKNSYGKVLELFISVKSDKKRLSKETLDVDVKGVLGDKFYAKDENRLILVTSTDAYSLAKANGVDLEYGDLGENILIDKSINHLPMGERFKIGEVVFEITQNCTLCNGLSLLDSKLPKILKHDRGIFVKAVTNGTIKKDNNVIV